MAIGKVKFFRSEKGFGFIQPKTSGPDIFVHVTGLTEEIQDNDEVEFDIKQGKKGEEACNVRKLVNA